MRQLKQGGFYLPILDTGFVVLMPIITLNTIEDYVKISQLFSMTVKWIKQMSPYE